MPILPLFLALLASSSTIDAGLIEQGTRVRREAESAATVAAESAAANEGLSLLQIFQDQSMSRAGIKQRVNSWANNNQFDDLVAAFEQSVRQRTLARREQAREAAVELPKALDTISEIEDDMLLTPSETHSKVDQTLSGFSPKLRSLVLTALEPTPLTNSTTQQDDVQESSGDLPVEVVEGSGAAIVEESGDIVVEGSGAGDELMQLRDEGSGAEVEGSGEGSGQAPLQFRFLNLRSPVEGSGVEGSGDVEGSGAAPTPFPTLLRDETILTSTQGTLFVTETTTITNGDQLPPIQVQIDVYDDSTSTPSSYAAPGPISYI